MTKNALFILSVVILLFLGLHNPCTANDDTSIADLDLAPNGLINVVNTVDQAVLDHICRELNINENDIDYMFKIGPSSYMIVTFDGGHHGINIRSGLKRNTLNQIHEKPGDMQGGEENIEWINYCELEVAYRKAMESNSATTAENTLNMNDLNNLINILRNPKWWRSPRLLRNSGQKIAYQCELMQLNFVMSAGEWISTQLIQTLSVKQDDALFDIFTEIIDVAALYSNDFFSLAGFFQYIENNHREKDALEYLKKLKAKEWGLDSAKQLNLSNINYHIDRLEEEVKNMKK